MARLPGLHKRLSKAEELELEIARERTLARLERLLMQREGIDAGDEAGDEPEIDLPDELDLEAEAGADAELPALGAGGAYAPDKEASSRDVDRQEPEVVPSAPVPALVHEAEPVKARGSRLVPSVTIVADDWDTPEDGDEASIEPAPVAPGLHVDATAAADAPAQDEPAQASHPAAETAEPADNADNVAAELAAGATIDEAAPAEPPAATRSAAPRRATGSATPTTATTAMSARVPTLRTPVPTGQAMPRTPAGRTRPGGRRTKRPIVLAACPSCAVLLEPPPTVSRQCPRCRQRVIVKRLEGGVLYLTQAAAAALEADRLRLAEAARHARARDRWLALAAAVGAPPANLEKLGSPPASADLVRAARVLYTVAANRAYSAGRREHRWIDAASVRRTQAIALHRAGGLVVPPPPEILDLYRDGVVAELRAIREAGREAALMAGACCDICRDDAGLVVRVSDELKIMRLPHDGCPQGLCRCRWQLARPHPTLRASSTRPGSSAATAAKPAKKARPATAR